MYNFAAFWEYTEQRIRYNENIKYLEDLSNLSLEDLKRYPPQQCAMPSTPILSPVPSLKHQMEHRNLLRQLSSPSKLRLSKTKQRDYLESFAKWTHKKYKKWKTKPELEEEEWDSYDSAEWETDSEYDDIKESPRPARILYPAADDGQPPKLDLLEQPLSVPPIEQQRRITRRPPSPPLKANTPLLPKADGGAVSELMRGPKYYESITPDIAKCVSSTGKRLRRRDPKAGIKWKGDEAKRLKVCISALFQMRFHDQLAYSGLLSSITLYMRTTLEMSSSNAAMVISVWTGLCYLTPLLAAYAADAKWGRAKTLILSQYVFFAGMFCVAISTYFGTTYLEAAHTLFWTGLFVISIGFGGFKPTLSPLGADQFDAKHKTDEQKRVAKEKRSSFFGWLYWSNQLGAIVASSVVAYICQNIDFSIGWSLASIALIFAIASFYSAKNYFICVPPEGSIFGDFLQVWCISCKACCAGKKPPKPVKPKPEGEDTQPVIRVESKEEEESVPLKVDVADPKKASDEQDQQQVHAPIADEYDPDSIKPSMLDWAKKSNGGTFEDNFVEDIKQALGSLPALTPFPVAYIIYTNLLTLVYSQGCQMNVHMGNGFIFPISSLSLISTITIIVFVPLTEKYLYPLFNNKCCTVSPLKKMGTAFVCAIIAMLISGITEIVRKNYTYRFPLDEMESPCGNGLPVSDMNILWQAPQFFLLGMSRVLINTGAQDFFYTESPKSMKSTLFSLNYAVDGIGAVLGSVSILAVNSGRHPWITNDLNDGHLELYFFVIGGIMCVLFGIYLVFASRYTYKEFKELKEGKVLRGK